MPIPNSAFMSDMFHLEGQHVPLELGEEESYELDDATQELRVDVVMRRCTTELTLRRDLHIKFLIRNQSATDFAIRCIPLDQEAFKGCALLEKCPDLEIKGAGGEYEIRMPWLENYKYPLGAWFYALRSMVQKPDLRPWTNPLLLRKDFPHKSTFYGEFPYPDSAPSVLRNAAAGAGGGPLGLLVGAGRTKGNRPYMEDFDFCYRTMRFSDVYSSVSLLGVFDGHGGAECGQFMVDEMPGIIQKSVMHSSTRSVCKTPLAQILHESFIQADKEFLRCASNPSGCTATVMMFEGGGNSNSRSTNATRGGGPGLVTLASTGDSRAVLCRGRVGIELTIDHKAGACDTVARVAQSGGFVSNGRVMGSLAVGRALGDSHLKRGKNLKKDTWTTGTEALIPDPDVLCFVPRRCGVREEDDNFIIIASDGLWDVMSSQEACDKVKNQVAAMGGGSGDGSDGPGISEKDIGRICDSMAIEAVNKLGSRDNVTVEICFFTGINGYSARSDAVQDEDVEVYRSSSSSSSSSSSGAKELGENRANYSGGGNRDYLSSMVASMSSPAKSGNNNSSSSSNSNSNSNSNSYGDESKHSSGNNLDDDDLMDFLNDDSNF